MMQYCNVSVEDEPAIYRKPNACMQETVAFCNIPLFEFVT